MENVQGKKAVFLILHYKTLEETRNCIASIGALDQSGFAVRILVVDNGSADGSYESLLQQYGAMEGIDIVTTGKNLGFSGGNNFGYRLIKQDKIDYLLLCNSDLEFRQHDFLQCLRKIDEEEPFDILGPDMYCERAEKFTFGPHQSPVEPFELAPFFLKAKIRHKRYHIAASDPAEPQPSPIQKLGEKLVWYALRGVQYLRHHVYRKKRFANAQKNVCIHGSCMIFSRAFLEKYREKDKLLDPDPFLYTEEQLLFLRVRKDALRCNYDPRLQVYHLEGAASEKSAQEDAQKIRFLNTQMIESIELYLRELEGIK